MKHVLPIALMSMLLGACAICGCDSNIAPPEGRSHYDSVAGSTQTNYAIPDRDGTSN